jgi:glutamate formiminotransferase
MPSPILLAVPNVSEGRHAETIAAVAAAFAEGAVRVLDVHTDPDHNRSVFTLAGGPGALGRRVLRGARAAIERIDVMGRARGRAPAGRRDRRRADRLPRPLDRGAACAEALVLGDLLADELEPAGVPLRRAGGRAHPRRAPPRRPAELARGWQPAGELRPDFGPRRLHPTAGAVLVAARPPLVAFNVELAPPADARGRARDRGADPRGRPRGAPGRARDRAVAERRGVAQVSTNVEDHRPPRSPTSSPPSPPRRRRQRRARRPGAARGVRGLPDHRRPGAALDYDDPGPIHPSSHARKLLITSWPRPSASAAQAPRHAAGNDRGPRAHRDAADRRRAQEAEATSPARASGG